MRLSTFSDYSLRVLLYVALRPGERPTIEEIATAYGISRNHLMKVVRTLGQLGHLTTIRGRGGGLRLARPPEDINLGEVLRGTEQDCTVVECLGDGPINCPLSGACRLTGMFGEALGAFFGTFDRYTLADALTGPEVLARRLGIPAL